MKYTIICEDESYKKALKGYLVSENFTIVEEHFEDNVFISDKIIENCKCVLLGNRNDLEQRIINRYQNMEDFLNCLRQFEWQNHPSDHKIISVVNGFGNSGSTILALNMCKILSSANPTFVISLDRFQKCKYYLPQDRLFSLSDLIFNLKRENNSLLSPNMTGFQYCNAPALTEDVLCVDQKLIRDMIEYLLRMGYQQIVIDLSNRWDLIDAYDVHQKFLVIPMMDGFLGLVESMPDKEDYHYIINQIDPNMYCNEINLTEGTFTCIDYDAGLKKGSFKWQSPMMQESLSKILQKPSEKL